MTVSEQIGLVDEAAKHVEKRQLITSVGIPPDWRHQLSLYDANMLLVYSESLSDISNWIFSDLLCWVEERVAQKTGKSSGREFWDMRNERWKELVQTSKRNLSQETLYNMKACAKAFPWPRRRHSDTIGYEHHRLIAHMSHNEQDYWLDEAQANGWSSYDMRLAIYKPAGNGDSPTYQDREEQVTGWLASHGMPVSRQAANRIALQLPDGQVIIFAQTKAGRPCLTLNLEVTT